MLDGLGEKDKEVESVSKIGINMMVVAFQMGRERYGEEGSGIRGLKKVQGQAEWEQGSSEALRGHFTSFTLHILHCQCLSGSLEPRPENPTPKDCILSGQNRSPFLWVGVRLLGSSPRVNSLLGQFGTARAMGFAPACLYLSLIQTLLPLRVVFGEVAELLYALVYLSAK